jgi:hypothetical protein
MNFFQPASANLNASVETLEKKRLAWNKGLSGDNNPQKGVSRPRQSELMKKYWAGDPNFRKGNKGSRKGRPASHTTYVYHTPAGIFNVRGDAMKANNVTLDQLISRCVKSKNHCDWFRTLA